jgi:DNA-binding GntR family transcriptional regulator
LDIEDLKIVDSPTLVRDHTVDKLRSAIGAGLYPPGTRLVERELCEALGVSRTSVREALRQLQSENLIEVGKRRNIKVAVITAADAADIYAIREMLETEAIRRFAVHADAKQVKRLQRVYKDLHKARAKGNARQLSAMAGEFYETIQAGAGSKVFYEMARQLLARVSYLRYLSMLEPGRLEGGFREWDDMMEAIVAHDPDRAAAAMSEHLRKSRAAIVHRLIEDEQAAGGGDETLKAAG